MGSDSDDRLILMQADLCLSASIPILSDKTVLGFMAASRSLRERSQLCNTGASSSAGTRLY